MGNSAGFSHAALFLAYISGMVGYKASPLHLCLVLTVEYFQSRLGGRVPAHHPAPHRHRRGSGCGVPPRLMPHAVIARPPLSAEPGNRLHGGGGLSTKRVVLDLVHAFSRTLCCVPTPCARRCRPQRQHKSEDATLTEDHIQVPAFAITPEISGPGQHANE